MKQRVAVFSALLAVIPTSGGGVVAESSLTREAIKISSVVVNIPAGGGASTTGTNDDWKTADGERVDMTVNGEPVVLLFPKGGGGYILSTKTRQAFAATGSPASFQQLVDQSGVTLPPNPGPSRNARRLAPVRFLGYLCTVREETKVVNGSLLHSQIWDARINHRTEVLRDLSQGADGRVFLFEAVSVQTYPQAPAGLLAVPKGYTVVAQK